MAKIIKGMDTKSFVKHFKNSLIFFLLKKQFIYEIDTLGQALYSWAA